MRSMLLAMLLIGFCPLLSAASSPYAGEHLRTIKSLSDRDIEGLLAGKGMGYAKAAELNRYPGPKHVLELAEQLELSGEQIRTTQAIFEKMRQQAIVLGKELIDREQHLDELFSSQQVSEASLKQTLQTIAELQARLRGVHLFAHLQTKQLLSQQQIVMYQQLRGYSNKHSDHRHTH